MALELETVHWEARVDSVFEDGGEASVPHYNYRLNSTTERLGSSNLEVFVEEELDQTGEIGVRSISSDGICSPHRVSNGGEDDDDSAFGSYRVNSSSSVANKSKSLPGKSTAVML